MSQSSNQSTTGDGNYVVVARRYRPRGFDELVGQEHVGRALTNAIETGRVGHAYLFTGARGVGKTTTARIFAKALNDPGGPTATPDKDSDVALAIDAGEDVDVIEIDGASNRRIDEIRSLRANINVRPSRSRFKIYIIDEVHMLTTEAFNALLKTLEEPPEHVKFIFCTTNPEKIPITVLSRCQRFDFAPVEIQKIVQRLSEIVQSESAEAEEAALELIARRAAGSMRDSQSLLEQVLSFSDGKLTADQVHAMLGTADDVRLHSLAKAMADRNAAEAIKQMDAAIDAGVDAGRLAEQLLGYFRDMMAATVGCDASLMRHTAASMHGELKSLGETWGLQTVLAVVGLIDQTLARIGRSVHGRVLMEAALIQICHLPDLQNIANLAAAADDPAAGEKKKVIRAAPKPAAEPTPTTNQVAAEQVAADQPANSTADQADVALPSASTRATDVIPPSVSLTPASTENAGTQAPATASVVSAQAESSVAVMAPPASQPVVWNQPSAVRVWDTMLSGLESMTETFARAVERVEAVGENRLKLVFPAEAGLAMQRCQLPEHQTALVESLSRIAGKPIKLDFVALPAKAKPAAESKPANRPSRQQRMREIESNPMIQSCVELFDAEIVRVEKPKPN